MRVSTGPVPLWALEATLQVTAGAHSLTVLGVDWAAAFTVVLLQDTKKSRTLLVEEKISELFILIL